MSAHVQEYGDERCRFMVTSRTNPKKQYLVDLLSNDGLGECHCRHWQTTIWPRIRDKKVTIDQSESRCWHVGEARIYFLNHLLPAMAKRETQR